MNSDCPANTVMPKPMTPTKIQGPADDSWRDFHKRGSATPAEALRNDPRHNPVNPKG